MKLKGNMSHAGRLALLAAAFIWGTSFVVLKSTLDSVPTLYVLAFRFTGAAVLMLPASVREFKKLDGRYIGGGVAMGILLFLAYVFQTYGLYYTTPGKNAFLTATYCVLVPFLYWLFFRRRPDRYNVIAALLCIVGIGLISLEGGLTMGVGDMLTIVSGLFFAGHILVIDRAANGRSAVMLSMLQFITAGILAWICALAFEPFPASAAPSAVWSIVYLCVMCTAVSFFLQTFGQKYTPPAQAAVLITLEAVFGAAISVLFGEVLTLRVFFGFLIVFAAVLISETKLKFGPARHLSGK